jgi:hypothetical protein
LKQKCKKLLLKKEIEYLSITTNIINSVPVSPEHQPNASAPMGLWLAPAGKTLSIRKLTSICIYASKTISLHKQEESQTVLESIKYIKHKVIVLLMLDAGLRISEACSINAKILILKSKYHNPISKKEEQNTCELFQYQTDFTKLSRIFKRMKFQ